MHVDDSATGFGAPFPCLLLHESETGEDDEIDEAVDIWNLWKCSSGLDVLSNVFGADILSTF